MRKNCPLLFRIRIKKLKEKLNLIDYSYKATDKIFINTVLWDFFKNIPYKRLDEACDWIGKNHEYKDCYKIPNVPAFVEALKATSKTKPWEPPQEEKYWNNEDVAQAARDVINSLKAKGRILNEQNENRMV